MINYNSASCLRTFLESEGLGMQKKFGQNFLINPQTREALINALDIQSQDEVWEIGPGLGAMTSLLLEKGVKVNAFEIDKGFIRLLKQLFEENKNLKIIEGDVMKTWRLQPPVPFLFGNLPYNIAAALLADFIEKGRIFKRAVVTVQKEVALRMAATAGSKDYSSFSVLCAHLYKVKPLMTIKPSSFYPKPNVDSMGVLLERREDNEKRNVPQVFYPLLRALFSSRRKTIKNNLMSFFTALKTENNLCADILKENELSGMERAEELPPERFYALANSIENMRLLK